MFNFPIRICSRPLLRPSSAVSDRNKLCDDFRAYIQRGYYTCLYIYLSYLPCSSSAADIARIQKLANYDGVFSSPSSFITSRRTRFRCGAFSKSNFYRFTLSDSWRCDGQTRRLEGEIADLICRSLCDQHYRKLDFYRLILIRLRLLMIYLLQEAIRCVVVSFNSAEL